MIEPITFADLKNYSEGLVLLGCGGDLAEWDNGVRGQLREEGIAHPDDFGPARKLTTTGGRVDLLLPFAPESKINVGKLAMWRLRFGDCSWLSDYMVNYASDNGAGDESFEEAKILTAVDRLIEKVSGFPDGAQGRGAGQRIAAGHNRFDHCTCGKNQGAKDGDVCPTCSKIVWNVDPPASSKKISMKAYKDHPRFKVS